MTGSTLTGAGLAGSGTGADTTATGAGAGAGAGTDTGAGAGAGGWVFFAATLAHDLVAVAGLVDNFLGAATVTVAVGADATTAGVDVAGAAAFTSAALGSTFASTLASVAFAFVSGSHVVSPPFAAVFEVVCFRPSADKVCRWPSSLGSLTPPLPRPALPRTALVFFGVELGASL